MASNTPFPFPFLETKSTILRLEDLIDYCIIQNWYDTSKEIDETNWTKPDKAMACLRASLSPAARTMYKYILV